MEKNREVKDTSQKTMTLSLIIYIRRTLATIEKKVWEKARLGMFLAHCTHFSSSHGDGGLAIVYMGRVASLAWRVVRLYASIS